MSVSLLVGLEPLQDGTAIEWIAFQVRRSGDRIPCISVGSQIPSSLGPRVIGRNGCTPPPARRSFPLEFRLERGADLLPTATRSRKGCRTLDQAASRPPP